MTAAIGAACGAGLAILAIVVTALHFVIVVGYRWVGGRMPRAGGIGFRLRVTYEDGRGVLRDVLRHTTEAGFSVVEVSTQRLEGQVRGVPAVQVALEVRGRPHIEELTAELHGTAGVLEVAARDLIDPGE